jgi:ABC-type glycerol-3-phosphate transport system permease component
MAASATRRRQNLPRLAILYVLSLILVLISIIPFLWMLSTSFKPQSEIYASPPVWFPTDPTLAGYINAILKPDLAAAAFNSLFIATSTTLLALVLAIGAGYGFARFRFFGREALAISVLFSQLLPASVVLIPLYLSFDALHLIDTYPSLILGYLVLVLPLCTWMLRGYFLGLPREIEEAGLIDGCSPLGVLWRLVLPLTGPAIVATGLYAFTVAWDEFLFALTFTQSVRTRTLPVELAFFTGEYSTDWSAVMAAAVMMSIPVIIIFLAFQRHFVAGLAEGAVKG